MRQIRSDVDQFVAQEPPPRCDIFAAYRTREPIALKPGALHASSQGSGVVGAVVARGASAVAQEGGDMQAQILYAYQAEDTNLLANLVQNLDQSSQSGRRRRGAALSSGARGVSLRAAGARRRSRTSERRRRSPTASISSSRSSSKMSKSAEALALQSACYAQLAQSTPPGGGAAAIPCRGAPARRVQSSRRAIPACLYLAADGRPCALEARLAGEQAGIRAIAGGGAAVRPVAPAPATMCRAGDTRKRISRSACSCKPTGDALGARNWIEKSLIVAPDYKAAQRQMASLVHR